MSTGRKGHFRVTGRGARREPLADHISSRNDSASRESFIVTSTALDDEARPIVPSWLRDLLSLRP
jgi:hypothetical protein